ncbi:RNA 2'-O ribose methyltransferase substrate binding family protein [Streptococcus pyogenes]|nr:RNA 2'-O ribose methyltransferase substrate binding family protein [Streptococcus pyogenes]
MVITSKTNQLIKQTKKLLQKKHRKQSYLIEGWHLFEEAQKSGQVFRHIFVLEEMVERLAGEQELVIVSPQVLKELTDSPSPQGIVAEVEIPKLAFPSDYKGKYLVLEDVQDPGNLGPSFVQQTLHGLMGSFFLKNQQIFTTKKPYVPCKVAIFIYQFGEQMSISFVESSKSIKLPS